MKKVLFIINPNSGRDRQKAIESLIRVNLDRTLFHYEIALTAYPGHATTLAKKAAETGTDIVAVAGGDGSVNEAAQGILDSSALLALIPLGSGNGLARALKIPRDVPGALRIINAQKVKNIDAGFANGRLFLSNAGVGFDALVARLFAHNTGRGLINYTRLVIDSLGKYRCKSYTLLINGERITEKAFFVAAANGNQFGYDFKIAPQALPDDGQLDICIMRPLRLGGLGIVALQALTGKIHDSRYVKRFPASEVTITRDEPLKWMQVDGDAAEVENDRVTISIRPKAIGVMIP